MGDNPSKIKLFIFCIGISLLINITAMICSAMLGNNVEISSFVTLGITLFIPFADTVSLFFLGLDPITLAIIGVFTGILGAVKLAVITAWITDFLPFMET